MSHTVTVRGAFLKEDEQDGTRKRQDVSGIGVGRLLSREGETLWDPRGTSQNESRDEGGAVMKCPRNPPKESRQDGTGTVTIGFMSHGASLKRFEVGIDLRVSRTLPKSKGQEGRRSVRDHLRGIRNPPRPSGRSREV